MKISIGLPTAVPGAAAKSFPEWARRAEAAGFESLGTIGRIAFDSHDELITLAAAAAVTTRLRLATTVLVAPPRETVVLAKQAATLDQLSEGRFILGLGAGWRENDFAATRTSFADRGHTLTEQIECMRGIWRGAAPDPLLENLGPQPTTPDGPPIWLGGTAPAALRRAGRYADAFIAPPIPAPMVQDLLGQVRAAASAHGRPPTPLIGSGYFALGGEVEAGRDAMRAYYSIGGEALTRQMVDSMLTDATAIRAHLARNAELGAEEVFLWSTSANPDQIEDLARIAL